MAKITQKTFKEALKNSGGNQARIAEKLEVTRQAIGLYLKKNPKMRELLDQEAEFVIDVAEDNIDIDIVTHKNIDASKWKLLHSKKGKQRGYGVHSELKVENIGISDLEAIKAAQEAKEEDEKK